MTEKLKPQDSAQYDSAALRNTHQFITIRAINILTESLEKIPMFTEKMKINFAVIKKYIEVLKKGCIAPDYGKVGVDRDYALYQDHFIDPDTDKNFTAGTFYPFAEVKDTAESQARNYFSRAVTNWLEGKYEEAIHHLGQALHYFEDANEPHHCLNWTGGAGTAHTRFEYYAEEVKEKYIVKCNDNVEEYSQFAEDKYVDFISKMVYKHARMAKALEPFVALKNSWEDWDHAIEVALGNAQKGAAIVIFRFLEEISQPKEIKITSPLGKGHVIIKVADTQYAGTDNPIYFGFKTKEGKDVSFLCDLPGDDFERGATGCYQFVITEDLCKDFNDMPEFYLRKEKSMGVDDQAFIECVEVYIQGKRVSRELGHTWLTSKGGQNVIKLPIK